MWAGIVLAVLAIGERAADPHPQGMPCPSPADVEGELARVGAVGVAPPVIEVIGDRMRVVLRGRDGASIGSREVDVPQTCHERATVAAILVATWMGIWPGAPKTANAPGVATGKGPSPPPHGRATSEDRRSTEIGLEVVGVHDGNAAALGVAFEVGRQLTGSLRGWAAVSATTERERSVGPGQGGYLRPALEMGPALRLGHGRVQADLAASGRLGLLIVRGKGLPVTHSKTHLIPGAAACVRLLIAGERMSPFVVVGGGTWFGRQELRLDNDQSTVELSRWDVQAGLGIFWSL